MSGIRQFIRNLEYSLPVAMQRPLLRMARDTPYSPEYDATRSIFVHTPKTAGTSIGEALYGQWVGHVPISRFAAFDTAKFESFFKFAFVRNPWDRLLSAFAHLKGYGEPLAPRESHWSKHHLAETESFESFVLRLRDERFRELIIHDVHFRPQLDWITLPGSDHIALDFVGRYETLEEDFANVSQRLGAGADLPIRKRTKRLPYRDAYTQAMRSIVEEIYQGDIARLDYRF